VLDRDTQSATLAEVPARGVGPGAVGVSVEAAFPSLAVSILVTRPAIR